MKLSRRTYNASLRWRQNGGATWIKDPCYYMTTKFEYPEDVLSDDEPVFQDGQEKWIGVRIDRTVIPDFASEILGEFS